MTMTIHKYGLVRVSRNSKVGPLPVSTSSRSTCPPTCPLMGKAGCYAESYPLAHTWNRVDKQGYDFDSLLLELHALPRGILWRHNQAGDLPGEGGRLDERDCLKLARAGASRHKRVIAYTHYSVLPASRVAPHNREVIQKMGDLGFVVNLSADNMAQADAMIDLGIAPVVILLPAPVKGGAVVRATKTPAGRNVLVCPAEWQKDATCATCQVCADPDRKVLIGFTAHGFRKAKASAVASGNVHP